jgi:feruloyl esterase
MKRSAIAVAVSGVVLSWSGDASAAQNCAALRDMRIVNVNLLSSVDVPAAGDLPAYCRVLGYVRPAINFEIRMPAAGWNGKFYVAGCGGFCGGVDADRPGFTNAANYGLRRNYAVVSTDAGHWGTSVVDGRWAQFDMLARMDWGQRAIAETTRVGKDIVKAYYTTDIRKSYFVGCSTGGRQAAMAAWKNPKDFDGIISGAPALDYTGLVATFFAWVTQANTDANGKQILSTAKAKLVEDAVVAACGNKQGIKDGLVEDPRACTFKPASLQCKSGTGADCLTEQEVGVLDKWYKGPTDSKGRQLFSGGVPLGSEANWPSWLTGRGNAPPLLPLFGNGFIQYMAFDPTQGAAPTAQTFNFDRDPPRLTSSARMYNSGTWNPDKPDEVAEADLSTFQQGGGKILFYHGWGDPLVTPFMTVTYFEALAKKAGGAAKTADFARLFMVPGMDHCGINTAGPGIADVGIDPLTALEQWVEDGKAPESLVATKLTADKAVAWKRPICGYPRQTKFNGGDPTDPASYSCVAP